MSGLLNHALRAVERGFHVFPVAAGDKVPHRMAGYRDTAGAYHGWGETATSGIRAVTRFWSQVDPEANIGIACAPSALLVVDLDVPKEPWKLRGTPWEYLHSGYGPVVTGEALWDEWCYALGEGDTYASQTYTVRTGSGGLHLYYRWEPFWPRISQASPAKGVIDVRGNGGQWGGYVLAEGSRTVAGEYTVAYDAAGLQYPPMWLRQLVAEKLRQPAAARPQGLRQPGPISWAGLVESVRHAGEGNRNNALVWAARTMCEEGATEQDALDTLGPAAAEAGLGDLEIERTVQSAFRTQRYKEGRS
ncbi:bifunctional DNA primase/polymerase [Streptomyces phage Dagobah]|nr:bifunctional DNA primase/polymerase [Streptomyces phage Dagobah]